MNKFEKLIELNKEFNNCLCQEWLNSVWYITKDNCVVWNGENNLEDLYDQYGDTYSGDVSRYNIRFEDDNCLLIELTNDCGGYSLNLFSKANKVEAP